MLDEHYTDGSEQVVKLPVHLPHEVLAGVGRQCPKRVNLAFFGEGGVDGIERFWSRNKHLAHDVDHPVYNCNACDDAVPMELFGDDSHIWDNERVLILTMKSCLVTGKTWDTTFLLAILPYARVIDNKTLNDLY